MFPFAKTTYAALTEIPSSNLNAIQDVLVDMNGKLWDPTLADVDVGDISARRGFFSRIGGLVYASLSITWNNSDGLVAGDPVLIDLPYQAADHSGGSPLGPFVTSAYVDPVASIWPDKATDRGLYGTISHISGLQYMAINRQSTTNTSPGALTYGTAVVRQLHVIAMYPTDGVKLI